MTHDKRGICADSSFGTAGALALFMKQTALLLSLLASLPLGACSMAPLDADSSGDEQADSTSDQLRWYVSDPAPTIIDFDRTPTQAAIANGATVDTTYTSLGVTFSCLSCSTVHAFARSPGRTGNGVSPIASTLLIPAFDAHAGGVNAEFTTPRSWVSVDVLSLVSPEDLHTSTAKPWLEAYNAAGKKIGSVYYPAHRTPGFGQWQTLRIDDPSGSIKSVRFSSQVGSPQVLGHFDNLSFNTDPYWIEATPLPKPPPIFRPVLTPPPATTIKF